MQNDNDTGVRDALWLVAIVVAFCGLFGYPLWHILVAIFDAIG